MVYVPLAAVVGLEMLELLDTIVADTRIPASGRLVGVGDDGAGDAPADRPDRR